MQGLILVDLKLIKFASTDVKFIPQTIKKKEDWLDWLQLAWELPYKTSYWRKDIRKDRSDGKTREKK
jgi:hypothetical protein